MSCFVASPAVGCTVVAMSELPFLILDSCHYLRFLSFRAQRGICSSKTQLTRAAFFAFFPFRMPRKKMSPISPANFASSPSTCVLYYVYIQFIMPNKLMPATHDEHVSRFARPR